MTITKFIREICASNQGSFSSFERLSGGDINDVYLIHSQSEKLVLKLNQKDSYPNMFKNEMEGLDELRKANAFIIPAVKSVGSFQSYSYLLMDYLPPSNKGADWEAFGKKLAKMHHLTKKEYGFTDNYIGSLPQTNGNEADAATFYIQHRLKPQFELAKQKGFDFENLEPFYERVAALMPKENASLIHGDLWSGNYLHTKDGFALIDPAVSYSIREMDLAMMKLFGGFPKKVFEVYEAHYPTEAGADERVALYQLYYLLVHLTIFGGSYLQGVQNCMRQYLN